MKEMAKEKSFADKFTIAVIMFARTIQGVMQDTRVSSTIAQKYEQNPQMTAEELEKEIATVVIETLNGEYDLSSSGGDTSQQPITKVTGL